jgi:uncharacterized protein YegL
MKIFILAALAVSANAAALASMPPGKFANQISALASVANTQKTANLAVLAKGEEPRGAGEANKADVCVSSTNYCQKKSNPSLPLWTPLPLPTPCRQDGSHLCQSPTYWNTTHCKCVSDCDGGDPTVPTECTDKEADIVFVLDSSGSISSSGWTSLLAAVGNIVTGLDIAADKMQVSAKAFSGNYNQFPGFDLDAYYTWQTVKTEILSFPWMSGGTLLGAAVEHANDNTLLPANGRRSQFPAAMIIITDGQTADPALATQQALVAQANGVKVFTIGVKNYNSAQLQTMASPDQTNPDGTTSTFQYGPIAGFDVDQFKTELLKAICVDPVTSTAAPVGTGGTGTGHTHAQVNK